MKNWFSISGITTEIKRIRWPKGEEFKESVSDVLLFSVFFGLFFVACESVVATLLQTIFG